MKKEVCISLMTLFERYKNDMECEKVDISCGEIRHSYQEETDTHYYDLYNSKGEIMCMDGETCQVISELENEVMFLNQDGENDVEFTLTKEEFEYATFTKSERKS